MDQNEINGINIGPIWKFNFRQLYTFIFFLQQNLNKKKSVYLYI